MAPAAVMQPSPAEGTKPEKQRKTWGYNQAIRVVKFGLRDHFRMQINNVGAAGETGARNGYWHTNQGLG